MNKDEVLTLTERVEREFLPFVRKPGRYIGGEINQIKKDLSRCELTVAVCFPDVYEVGMSHTGLAIIYDCVNRIESVADVLREKNIPLFSLESRASLKSFDIVGFSLTNELCYTNMLDMLDLGGIGIRGKDRGEDDPLIIAGGGMSNCCKPIADFVDVFMLGLVKGQKKAGARRKEVLAAISEKFDWAYVPEFYDGRKLHNAVVADFDSAPVPLSPIVPFVQAVHERVSVEIMRGCPGRCRFCQASFCRRPIRYRSVERIIEIAKACYETTGFDTVSLLSLSTADYPDLEELVAGLHAHFHDKHVGISLPSLRVDKQLKMLPRLLTSVRKGGLTIAVEAASEHLRLIVNKPLKNEDLFAAVEAAYRAGWQRLKLYFMVGLPGETLDDVERIVDLSFDLGKLRKKVDGKTGQINVAISWFVPKPHTPLAWLGQRPKSYFEQAKQLIIEKKLKLRAKFLQFKFHGIDRSILESAIGRGDRSLGAVIETAWRAGARFDLWDECFDYELWRKAFEQSGIDVETAAQKQFAPEDPLPWDNLGGPEKKYLLGHLEKTKKEIENSECRM